MRSATRQARLKSWAFIAIGSDMKEVCVTYSYSPGERGSSLEPAVEDDFDIHSVIATDVKGNPFDMTSIIDHDTYEDIVRQIIDNEGH